MHHIDRALWNHNSLSPGDVNQDGYLDYAVIHEGRDVYSIVFHPGESGDVRKPWRKVVVGGGGNVEYAYLGDFDGDRNLDLVGVGGYSGDTPTGVKIIWGPAPDQLFDRDAWIDSGYIPGSVGAGHYLFVESYDINKDGALDIVTGARVHRRTRKTGICWIEAPKNKADRRDLSKWTIHPIDAKQFSGHGFEFTDIDQDGDDDLVLVNADWDTTDEDERLLWYENPGPGSAAQREAWPQHEIYNAGHQFFAKAQVAVGDLNDDGLDDLVVQTDNHLIYCRKKSVKPLSWEPIIIPKPAITRWVNRPINMVDLNNNGKMDLVGALIHNYGYLPRDKAAVYWMEYEGHKPGSDNWSTHVIKWADGHAYFYQYLGEKWDHLRFDDVDRDGDIDIVANAEEHHDGGVSSEKPRTYIGVVWFENELNERSR
jgi:hypothetical protein